MSKVTAVHPRLARGAHLGRRTRSVIRLVARFVNPLTFSDNASWYQNVIAVGSCLVTYQGQTYSLVDPRVVDYAAAAAAFPRYELWQFRMIGIDEFLVMRIANGEI